MIPTRAEMRSALYDLHEAETAWRAHQTEEWSAMLNATSGPSTDAAGLHAACAQAWRQLINLADRLPEVP